MIKKEQQQIQWLEFELFEEFPWLQHGIILRTGGASKGNFSSLNLSRHVGDSLEDVEANLQKICSVFSLPVLHQNRLVHGSDVVSLTSISNLSISDGTSTQEKNLGLLSTHADCQVALFYDPICQVIANIHCGWRGNVKNIYAATVPHLKECYGCKPENLLVGISPSLGPENAQFIHYRQELPKSFWAYEVKPNYFDFWSISEGQLREAGILPDHIQMARIDTYADPENYFSYRRDKLTGRNGSFICLKVRP